MVETYKLNQALLEKANGEIWILVDILETKSLLNTRRPSQMVAFLRPSGSSKLKRVNFDDLNRGYTSFLNTDSESMRQVMQLERLLLLDAPVEDII